MTIWVWWHDETNLPCSVAPVLKVGLISPPNGPYGCHEHGRWRKFQEVEEQPHPAQASERCPRFIVPWDEQQGFHPESVDADVACQRCGRVYREHDKARP